MGDAEVCRLPCGGPCLGGGLGSQAVIDRGCVEGDAGLGKAPCEGQQKGGGISTARNRDPDAPWRGFAESRANGPRNRQVFGVQEQPSLAISCCAEATEALPGNRTPTSFSVTQA